MRTVIITFLATLVLAVIGGFAFIYSGMFDVSATRPHWPITHWVLETVRTQSIKVQAAGIAPPPDMMNEARLLNGTEHFAAHCASCHGAPGVPLGEIANGLYPKPPDLAHASQHYTPGELFWIVKNGIKMSGMPSWSDHSDDEIWGTVAFIQKLPGMSEADYGKLVMQSMTHGGGRHGHGADDSAKPEHPPIDHPSMPGTKAPEKPDAHQH